MERELTRFFNRLQKAIAQRFNEFAGLNKSFSATRRLSVIRKRALESNDIGWLTPGGNFASELKEVANRHILRAATNSASMRMRYIRENSAGLSKTGNVPDSILAKILGMVESMYTQGYWGAVIDNGVRNQLRTIVNAGASGQLTDREVSRLLSAHSNYAHNRMRAKLITRARISHAMNAAAHFVDSESLFNPNSGVVGFTWVSMKDDRVRPTHVKADGQRVYGNQPFLVGGHYGMYPCDPQLPAKETSECRCVLDVIFSHEVHRDEVLPTYDTGTSILPSDDEIGLAPAADGGTHQSPRDWFNLRPLGRLLRNGYLGFGRLAGQARDAIGGTNWGILNQWLRGDAGAAVSGETVQQADGLFARWGRRVRSPLTVFRGATMSLYPTRVGSRIVDDGYMRLFGSSSSAAAYAAGLAAGSQMLRVELPSGTLVLPSSNVADLEVILPRGSVLEITGSERVRVGRDANGEWQYIDYLDAIVVLEVAAAAAAAAAAGTTSS
jgi:hypothetical protein